MELGLDGKTALLLASSGGLGFAIAQGLADEGVRVVVIGRNREKLDASVDVLRRSRPSATAFGICRDLSNPGEVDDVVRQASDAVGPIDIVLANCGGPPVAGALEVSDASWEQHFRSMFLAPVRAIRAVVPGMVERGWGRVIAITSSGVPQPIPDMAISNALRAALTNWLKTLAAEVAGNGVTVNTLVPGRIHTDRVAQLEHAIAERTRTPVSEVHDQAIASIPARREGETFEFAGAAVFLASRYGAYTTGAAIRVDGGLIRSPMS